MILGYCGSSNSCGSMSCNRRLEEQGGNYTTETASLIDVELSAKCTEAVKALATLIVSTNKCLGADPSEITCSVSETE
jgi:hypothetical protein